MADGWTSNDWSILMASCAGLVASCFAGARLSNCVRISVCGPDGWLHIERRLQGLQGQQNAGSPTLPRLRPSSIDTIDTIEVAMV